MNNTKYMTPATALRRSCRTRSRNCGHGVELYVIELLRNDGNNPFAKMCKYDLWLLDST